MRAIRLLTESRGSVLLISMVMLLVISVLAITSFQTSDVEMTIAGNDVRKTQALMAAEAGLAGLSIEDTALPGSGAYAFDLACARIEAAAAAAREADIVLCARADGWLQRSYDQDEAVRRCEAFAAGLRNRPEADVCVFAHAGVIRILACHLTGRSYDDYLAIAVPTGSVLEVDLASATLREGGAACAT